MSRASSSLLLLSVLTVLSVPAAARAEELPVAELAKKVGPSIARLGMFTGGEQQGNGTGFFIREDGIAVTNHHVIEHADGDEFIAVLADGTRRTVLGILADDPEHDIAIIRVEGKGFPALEFAASGSVTVGAPAYLIGSSSGLDQSLGVGVVSAIRDGLPQEFIDDAKRVGRTAPKGPIVQHTATSAAGSSGSPVLNGKGEVIAVHHSGLVRDPIYFAAHVDLLRALIARTDLNAKPAPLGPDRKLNLIISGAFFAALTIAGGVWALVRRRREDDEFRLG
ncbi:MAG: serine protease [Myxococcales bacterium]